MPSARTYEFDRFRLDAAGRLLFRDGKPMSLTPKAVELLSALVEAGGHPVSREDLLRKVWADALVEEGSLTSHVSMLRKALSEGADGREFIETISKRGYRFVGHIREVQRKGELTEGLTLAVLPFENLSGGEKHDYFSEGLTEEMITQLARLNPERLRVIARTSAMQYKSTTKTVQQIGHELGVSYVLEGSVRRAGERVRITAQLIRASDETHLWAESYERSLHDVLALQIDVAMAIAREIKIKLTPGEQKRMEHTAAISAQAYEEYLRGRHFWNIRTEEGMRKSIDCFQSAIKHEPKYAAAFDGIADAYTMLACRGISPAQETFHKAKMAARQALEIDPELGEAYASLAHVRLHDWDWLGLEQDFRRALELNPGHAIAHYWYAEYLMAMGRSEESVTRVRRIRQMDPLNPLFNASIGMILYLSRRFDEAVDELRKALEVDPHHFLLHFRLGLVYPKQRKFREAIAEMEQAVALSGRSTETLAGLAQAYAAAGMKSEMQKIVEGLQRDARTRYVSPYNVARVFGMGKDRELTFAWLEKAYAEHNPDLIEVKMEPAFDTIRSDARFDQLLSRIGFN